MFKAHRVAKKPQKNSKHVADLINSATLPALSHLYPFEGVLDVNLLNLHDLTPKGLHYAGLGSVTSTKRCCAVILGGGWVGRCSRRTSSSMRCSGSGWV